MSTINEPSNTNTIYDAIVQSNKFLAQKKEKSTMRKKLIAKSLGLKSSKQAIHSLESEYEKKKRLKLKAARHKQRHKKNGTSATNKSSNESLPSLNALVNSKKGQDQEEVIDESKGKEITKEENDIPKNDYNQYFLDTGQRPQNFIRDPGLSDRFEEYPKLRELIRLKDELIERTNLPPYPLYYKCDLIDPTAPPGTPFKLSEHTGDNEFDVVLIEPPLHDYQRTNGVHFNRYFTWDDIKAIDIESVASQRSFVFLWCGAGEGLDKGRECLKKWGFRRCEDICWIKTNKKSPMLNRNVEPGAIFQRVKEHCLMGIRGTVRRSTDNDYIHTNVDIDLIITEEPEHGNPDKPKEIFNIIEHFCLGRRRLYLFGRDSTVRPGWVTVGPDLSGTNFDKIKYKQLFENDPNGYLCGTSERIEMLRPKTPPHKSAKATMFSMDSSNMMMLDTAQQPPPFMPPHQFMPILPASQQQPQTSNQFNNNDANKQQTTSTTTVQTN